MHDRPRLKTARLKTARLGRSTTKVKPDVAKSDQLVVILHKCKAERRKSEGDSLCNFDLSPFLGDARLKEVSREAGRIVFTCSRASHTLACSRSERP